MALICFDFAQGLLASTLWHLYGSLSLTVSEQMQEEIKRRCDAAFASAKDHEVASVSSLGFEEHYSHGEGRKSFGRRHSKRSDSSPG